MNNSMHTTAVVHAKPGQLKLARWSLGGLMHWMCRTQMDHKETKEKIKKIVDVMRKDKRKFDDLEVQCAAAILSCPV